MSRSCVKKKKSTPLLRADSLSMPGRYHSKEDQKKTKFKIAAFSKSSDSDLIWVEMRLSLIGYWSSHAFTEPETICRSEVSYLNRMKFTSILFCRGIVDLSRFHVLQWMRAGYIAEDLQCDPMWPRAMTKWQESGWALADLLPTPCDVTEAQWWREGWRATKHS